MPKINVGQETISKIKEFIEQGISQQKTADAVGISRKVLNRVCKENNIKFVRPKIVRKKYVISQEMIDTIISMTLKGYTRIYIANILNISHSTVDRIRKDFNVKNPKHLKNVAMTEEQVEQIKEYCSNGKSKTWIAKQFDISTCKLDGIINKHNIKITESSLNKRGKKKEWTEEMTECLIDMWNNDDFSCSEMVKALNVSTSSLRLVAKSLNLKEKNRRSVITQSDVQYYSEFHAVKSIQEMALERNISERTVLVKLKKLGYKEHYNFEILAENREFIINSKEFKRDYEDPFISAANIAMKYKFNDIEKAAQSISTNRRKDFGKDFCKAKTNNLNNTIIEYIAEQILLDMDIAYIKQFSIGSYTIDFYLGHKMILEIDGDYWHNKEKTIKKDKEKKDFLNNSNYKVLIIKESEFKNKEQIVDKIKSFYYENLCRIIPRLQKE